MAHSPEQIQQAMRRAMAAGDSEAVADLRQRLTEAYNAEVPGAAEGMSRGQQFRAGIGQGMVNIGRQVQNLVGARSDEQLSEDAARDASLLGTGAGRAGAFVGETAATLPLGMGAGKLAGALAPRMGMTGRAALAGATEGAAAGGLAAGPGKRLGGAVQGAGIGVALPGASAALRRAARPVALTRDARRLVEQGVRLTPGEMNPTGRLNQWEQALQSSAFGGTAIRNARDRAMQDFRRIAGETAGPPGTKLRQGLSDQQMIADVDAAYGRGYEGAIGGYTNLDPRIVRTAGGDVPLHTYNGPQGQTGAMVDATSAAYPGRLIKPDERTAMRSALEGELTALPRQGPVSARDLQGVRSNIRSMARDTEVPGERALLRGGERKMTEALESQINPADAARLRELDQRYRDYVILQDAVARSRGSPGGFTPHQLESSIAKASSLGDYTKGQGGPLHPLSRSAKKVFEQRVQPTGERQVLTGMFGRLGTPVTASALALGTKVPTKVVAGMTPTQRKLQAKLRALRRRHGTKMEVARAGTSAAAVQREKLQEERGED